MDFMLIYFANKLFRREDRGNRSLYKLAAVTSLVVIVDAPKNALRTAAETLELSRKLLSILITSSPAFNGRRLIAGR